ncbi:MAG TPA: MoaD/ThiS family protein [Cyclobacteriaceae bacterium]|nr:MoaD/ThiS family protein [Cyclobacteriaceae bacterium]HPW60709.1 MoaD/ThiS family protein [Cyclobacteriaceae bacterium]HRG79644.1 MoaD/ThiS family protein [Cyclobacteriaceae bacterium]
MILKIKTFGISRDILGGRVVELDMNGTSVGDLRKSLSLRYPQLDKLNSLFIAVNQEYAEDEKVLSDKDEIALIPPVSGG